MAINKQFYLQTCTLFKTSFDKFNKIDFPSSSTDKPTRPVDVLYVEKDLTMPLLEIMLTVFLASIIIFLAAKGIQRKEAKMEEAQEYQSRESEVDLYLM